MKRRGLYDDAAIVFVSDHGEELWEHGAFGHSLGRLYDEAVRVPLIVKPAGKGRAGGRVVETQVRAFDVMPTLLEFAGLPVTGGLDARSLVPLLAADGPDRLAVIETRSRGLAVRNRRWKYILESWRKTGPMELLFDLQADPDETNDVAPKHPDVTERMRVQALDYRMLHRPGRYVVVIGDETATSGERVLRDVKAAYPIFGIPPAVDEDGSVRFDGESEGPLVLVSLVRAAGPILVGETNTTRRREFTRYAAGVLDRLVRQHRTGVHLFEGPPPVADESQDVRTMDQQQLEALRALGYLGDDEDPYADPDNR